MPGSHRKSSAPGTYRRHRAAARSRFAAITLAGQDIGALPPVADMGRRTRANRDFRFFCEQYFPHLFTLAWSQDHLRVIAKIERVVLSGETLAVAMPRGSGKTTLCLVAVIWAMLSGEHRFVYLIASTHEAGLAMLANIKSHLAGNDLLLADYPESVFPIRCLEGETRRCNGQRYYSIPTRIGWGVEELIMPTIPGSRSSGAIVRVSGITGNIRGALHARADGSQDRPSLVVCDDPQTDQSARSVLQTAERLSIVNGAISGLAGPGQRTSIIIPCTVIQHGDLADQLLDRAKNPSWHGERTKLVYSFPTNLKLWAEYQQIRQESLRSDGTGLEATEFYSAHRESMDAGAVMAWPQRYLRDHGEISAVQHAMNLKIDRGDVAFFAEYQNEPLRPSELGGENLTIEKVCAKANGRPRGQVPITAIKLTAFVDVHKEVLFYCVCGWEEQFAAGYVIEYGTFPEQGRAFFTLRSATRTLGRAFAGAGMEGAVQAGLQELVGKLLAREFRRGEGLMRIEQLLVDMGWEPGQGVIAAVKHKVGGSAMIMSKGIGIRAARQPMKTWKRRPGERHGHHWVVPNVSRSREFPHVLFDSNFWKTQVHNSLLAATGDRGGLTIFGKPQEHENFARQIAEGEQWTDVSALGRTVREWSAKPGQPDNHWLDCLVGCAVAASVAGVRPMGGEAEPWRQRKRYTQADLLRRRA